jgi:hypothetical protein
MAKTSYKYYTAPVYDLSFSNKTSLTAGVTHEVSASLSNAAKLSVGTEIKGGISTSLKFGYEIEFKHPYATKYEIDIDDEQIKDTRAGTTNVYNADNFRVTAGEMTAVDPANRIKSEFLAEGRRLAFYALLFQLAATSLTISTALKANLDASDDHPDVPFWGGGGGQGTGATYWASWSTVLIEGFSLVSLVLAFLAGRAIDSSKRKSPTRHQNFLNMDKNTGIMLGVQKDSPLPSSDGSWYLQNNKSVEIGCSDAVEFIDSLANVKLPADNKPGRLTINQDGVKLEGGAKGIENKVDKGEFSVKVGNDAPVRLTKDTSFVGRPGAQNFGLEMKANKVKLSVDQDSDLCLGTDVVRLRKKGGGSLALKANAATLAAQTVTIVGQAVKINGVEFNTGVVKMGDLTALLSDVSGVAKHAEEVANSTAETVASLAAEAKQTSLSASERVSSLAAQIRTKLERHAAEFKSTISDVTSQIKRLRG